MDSQLGNTPDADDEWAVEKILTHAGSGVDASFKILWKSGDVTWLPYYQIQHLQALESYLELLGIDNASKLPSGKGKPPQEDPQVFLGALSLTLPSYSPIRDSLLPAPNEHSPDHPYSNPAFVFIQSGESNTDHLLSNKDNLCVLTLDDIITMLDGIRHPFFRRVALTEYALLIPRRGRTCSVSE